MVKPHRNQSPEEARKQKLRLWLQLLKTSRQIENEVRERFRVNFDTTLPRFDVLAALARNPAGLRMSELSRALRVSNGNTTTVVDRLVADGLVVRVTIDDDRRAFLARLTTKGHRSFAAMAEQHELWIDDIIDSANIVQEAELSAALKALVSERT